MGKWIDIVRGDHGKIKELFLQLMRSPKDERARKDGYYELRREVARHTLYEEDVVYPKLKLAGIAVYPNHAVIAHHGFVDRLLTRLDHTPVLTSHWEALLREFYENMLSHMAIEERSWFK